MSSMQTLERRIQALEARLADVESGYAQTLYKLHRRAVRVQLDLGKVLDHLGIAPVTDDEVDAVIDQE